MSKSGSTSGGAASFISGTAVSFAGGGVGVGRLSFCFAVPPAFPGMTKTLESAPVRKPQSGQVRSPSLSWVPQSLQVATSKQKESRPTPTPPPAKETAVPDMKEAAPPEVEPDLDIEEGMAPVFQKKPEASTPAFTLDPPGLRKLLARQPHLLEPGLRLVADKKGKPIGAGLST